LTRQPRECDAKEQSSNMADSLPPRYAFRLEDLRTWHLVRVSCHECAHKAVIPHASLLRGRPGYTRLTTLERQLCCRKCGARGQALAGSGHAAAGLNLTAGQSVR
jgi:hypothetical protein